MNIKKIITLVLIVLLINLVFLPNVYGISKMISDGDKFVSTGGTGVPISNNALKDTSSTIYNILLGIGIAVAVIVGAFLGIQFIFGSVEGKAKIAEALVPYIIGCAVVFGAFGIWKFVANTGSSITNQPLSNEEVAAAISDRNQRIRNGEIGSFSDEELKTAYRSNNIDGNLNSNVNDARKKPEERMEIDAAVKNLTGEQKIIYEECKKRGLIEVDPSSKEGNGIWLKN